MLNSEFVHCMRTAFNPFMLNGISHCYQLKQSSLFEGILVGIFHFYSKLDKKLCNQTVETLIKHRVRQRRLIWAALFANVPEKEC